MKTRKVKGLVLAVVMLAAGMISACGGSPSSAAPASSQTESAEVITEAVPDSEKAESENTDVQVTEISTEVSETSDAEAEASSTEGNTMIANPWMDTVDLDEATADAGVDFIPPEADYIGGFEDMALQGYRSMTGTIEADYSNGADEVCVRKSSDLSGEELAGDYNEYSQEWELQAMGVTISCKGDGSLINVATFGTDEYAYSIVCNPGREGSGMEAEDLQRIIQFMQ